ncbi:Riboflavin synthase eubacterial/eukaryotic [hydrothermal vent metagenome]|uniref:Riboflavin synthase n=1 Tax=hydrothermal vent metagenome TaxID=652676 RepID=A0A3B1E185_9ZZZZ
MFTGLVEGLGTVLKILPEEAGIRLIVTPPEEMLCDDAGRNNCSIGDSVAINGCCLTVIEMKTSDWSFQAGEETLSKTNLGNLQPGDTINLERPLSANGQLGGHFVQGHVDGIGTVDSIEQDGEWVTMWFRLPEPLALQMVPKGSVTVDGISLTVVDIEKDRFSVALIPHTLEVTTLGKRAVGQPVNIETDILGKYVQKFMMAKQTIENSSNKK